MIRQINRIGIVGAGISSLVLAINLCKTMKMNNQQLSVMIYQENSYAGGRVLTKNIADKQKSQKYFLDMGANLIDFENQASFKDWNELLPKSISKNLSVFSRPFLLYQNNKYRKGDYQKERYFYNGGFHKLIEDLTNQLEKSLIKLNYNHQVKEISIEHPQVSLIIQGKAEKKIYKQKFDKIYLGCPAPAALKLFKSDSNAKQSNLQQLIDFYGQVKYTRQISVAFTTMKNIQHQFSCILFKNHPILSFICSHQEKYGQETYVTQTNEQFSQINFQEPDQLIADLVYKSLPEDIRQITCKQHLLVHRWPVSLVKPQKSLPCVPTNEYIELIGDSTVGKSRVSGSVQSTKRIVCKL